MTATVRTGVGKGGNITIDPQFVVMQGSQVRADALGGPGGNIHIVAAVFLADPASQVSASSVLDRQGVVNIQAPMPGELGPYLAARPEFDRKKTALLEEYKIPEALADYESKLREAATNPGHHEDWDFAYGEFTHTVDNARKVLFLDPARRSEVP